MHKKLLIALGKDLNTLKKYNKSAYKSIEDRLWILEEDANHAIPLHIRFPTKRIKVGNKSVKVS